MPLNKKQRDFIAAYLDCWNGAEAARRAGYSEKTARSIASENLTKPDIQAEIQAHIAQIMPAGEVLQRLADQARGSMGNFLRTDEEEITLTWSLLSVPTTEDGEPDMAGVMMRLASQENVQPTDRVLHTATIKRAVARLDLLQAEQLLHLGKKYSLDEKGKVSIELYDAQAALIQLGKHHKLFVDRTELTGKDGAPIAVVSAADLAEARKRAQDWEAEQSGRADET